MPNKQAQTPPKMSPQAGQFKGNGVKYREQGPTLIDNGVGPKKKTTKND